MKHFSHNLMWMETKFSPWESQFTTPTSSFHQEPFGGFVWPPRSYTCTFCRREFRSAQALGGHMNVHRRDRARLKQSQLPQTHHRDQKQTCDQEIINRTRRSSTGCNKDEVDHKRCKKSSAHVVSSPLPFLPSKLCSTSSSMEGIDLELRLGAKLEF